MPRPPAAVPASKLRQYVGEHAPDGPPGGLRIAPQRRLRNRRYSAPVTISPEGNLPVDIAAFVGRDAELAQAADLLSHVRLLTLTGPGGVGKTRLATHIARRLQPSMHDGVWMVDLGVVQDAAGCTPERLYAHMALALGIRHHGAAGLDVLLDHLRTRRVLLVLDNCEHLVSPLRDCVTALLRAAPQMRILATSRQVLGVDGEYTFVVPPLPLPDAVTLFTAHATAAGVDVAAQAAGDVVARLCRRLDGLPLAIRLAAGRVRTLSVEQLLHRLDDPFRLLTDAGSARAGTAPRHSALERVVDWSYELCTEAEQRLWTRACVFNRAFDLSALEAVCAGAGIDRHEVVDLVTGLVDKSVFAVDNSSSPARYSLLDTLRDYGLRKLAATGEMERMRALHVAYYRDLVARAAATWFGPAELEQMAIAHHELPDILAAIDHCVVRRDLATARALCRDLVRLRAPYFWGFLDLVTQQLHRVMAAGEAVPVADAAEAVDRASAATAAAWVAVTQGRHETAKELLTAAHDLHQRWAVAATAPLLFAEGASEALGAGNAEAIGLLSAARTAFAGDDTRGDRHMATMMWAIASAFMGDPAAAVNAGEEYLRDAEAAGAPWAVSWALWAAGLAALHDGDHERATDLVGRSLRLQRDVDDHWGQTWGLELCAWIIAARLDQPDEQRDEAERAAWLLGAAAARQSQLGVTLAGLRPFADCRALACERIAALLDDVAIAAAMAAGSRGQAHAVRVALGEPISRRPSASGAHPLTSREREVAVLVAQGLTSTQIGLQLRIRSRTVDVHVRNILHKLGVSRRAAIAAWIIGRPDYVDAQGRAT